MEKYQRLSAICLLFLSAVALTVMLSLAKTILIPFTLAIFVFFIFSPAVAYLYNKVNLAPPVAIGLTFLGFILTVVITVFLINVSINSFLKDAGKYTKELRSATQDVSSAGEEVGLKVSPWEIRKKIQEFPSPEFVEWFVSKLAQFVTTSFLVVVFALFLMAGESVEKKDYPIFQEIKFHIGNYMGLKLLTSAATGVLTYIVLKVFNIEMAFMFATLTFLLNFIPNFGSVVAGLLPAPIIFLQHSFGIETFACLGLMLVIHIIIGNVIEPRIQGDSMGLHPVTVLFGLTFWGTIWGVPGMFMAVPITASSKIILEKFEFTKPFARILEGDLRPLASMKA